MGLPTTGLVYEWDARWPKFQERTGASATTPAVAASDPVGSWSPRTGSIYLTGVSADNRRPLLQFDTANRPRLRSAGIAWLESPTFTTLNQPFRILVVGASNLVGTERWVDSANRPLFGNANSTGQMYAGSNVLTGGTLTTAVIAMGGLFNGTSSRLNANRVQLISGSPTSPGSQSLTKLYIFADPSGVAPLVGDIMHVAVYDSNADDTIEDQAILYMMATWQGRVLGRVQSKLTRGLVR